MSNDRSKQLDAQWKTMMGTDAPRLFPIDLAPARSVTEAPFDSSVLGYTKAELDEMDEEERAAALRDCLNRAADLLQATADAFKADLTAGPRSAVREAAADVIRIVRKLPEPS